MRIWQIKTNEEKDPFRTHQKTEKNDQEHKTFEIRNESLQTLCSEIPSHFLKMAALKSPFCGETKRIDKLMEKIHAAQYPPLPDDCYSPQLQQLINVCLNPVPTNRPNAMEVNRVAQKMVGICWRKFNENAYYITENSVDCHGVVVGAPLASNQYY